MRLSKVFVIVIILLLFFAFYFFYTQMIKSHRFSIKYFWNKEFISKEIDKNISREKIINETAGMKNETIKANESSVAINESSAITTATQQKNYTKPLTLRIVSICSGKLENVFSISEGTRKCLNAHSPCNILIEKNSTHIKTSVLSKDGFNETFEINDTVLIYFLFAEDVSTISKEIERIYLEGSDYFFIGDYELQTIWELDSSGNLYISKIIAVLPLYVKTEVKPGRYYISLILKALEKTYYFGELEINVK